MSQHSTLCYAWHKHYPRNFGEIHDKAGCEDTCPTKASNSPYSRSLHGMENALHLIALSFKRTDKKQRNWKFPLKCVCVCISTQKQPLKTFKENCVKVFSRALLIITQIQKVLPRSQQQEKYIDILCKGMHCTGRKEWWPVNFLFSEFSGES